MEARQKQVVSSPGRQAAASGGNRRIWATTEPAVTTAFGRRLRGRVPFHGMASSACLLALQRCARRARLLCRSVALALARIYYPNATTTALITNYLQFQSVSMQEKKERKFQSVSRDLYILAHSPVTSRIIATLCLLLWETVGSETTRI